MSTQLQFRRGNTAQTSTFTGAVAELTVNTDNNTLIVHDGTTSGGFPLSLQSSSLANVGAGLITVTGAYQANAGAGNITVTNAFQANVGQLRLDTSNANTSLAANIGAARIADVTSGQANVGAGLITVTSAYEANVGQLRLDTSNANTSLAANIGAARIADVASGQANVGVAIASGQANVGAGLITVTSAYEANVGAARIADVASGQANVGAVQIAKLDKSGGTISGSLIVTGDLTISGNTTTINTTELNIADNEIVLNTDWPANVYPTQNAGITINRGTVANSPNVFIRWNETNDYWVLGANVDEFIIATTANTGAGDITVTNAYQANVGAARIADVASGQANVGAARIADVASGQANVGAVQIAKVNKSGDVMTGTLTTNSEIIGSSITANNTLTINTNAVYESYTSTTSTTSQFALDTFSTSTYRSAKYLVQISSGSAYELIELSLIHDGTNVYLSQYGNIKSGSTLGVFDSTISTGVLSLLATPNNAITTFRAVATLITV